MGVVVQLFLLLPMMAVMVSSSGRLVEPISRASAWRVYPGLPQNRDDDKVRCGGAKNQWENNGGKCGVCGDAWELPQPRPHEGGGKFANAYITGWYNEGQVIQVGISLTNNKLGWFEFRACPHNNFSVPVSEECLDNHLLKLKDTDSTRFWIPKDSNKPEWYVSLDIQLPPGLHCKSQCVFQWKYQTETVTDDCSDCYGKEQFYACSDISIYPLPTTKTPTTTPPTTTTPTTTLTTKIPTTTKAPTTPTTTTPTTTTLTTTKAPTTTPTTTPTSTKAPTTAPTTTTPTTTSTTTTRPTPIPTTTPTTHISSTKRERCYATEDWKNVSGPDMTMDEWCDLHCPLGNCPPDMCVCDGDTPAPTDSPLECLPTEKWEHLEEMHRWCRVNCNRGHCPEEYCWCPHLSTTPAVTIIPTTGSTRPPVSGADILCIPKRKWRWDIAMWMFCWKECGYRFCAKELCDCRILELKSSHKSTTVNSDTISKSKVSNTFKSCRAIGAWFKHPDLHRWCEINCGIHGICPKTFCKCTSRE